MIFLGWGGVSERYKNVTFCNIFSGFLCPCVGVVYLREDPCELGIFPSFGVLIFLRWGGVFEDCKNVLCNVFGGFLRWSGISGFRDFAREYMSRICRIFKICRISQEHFSGSGDPELQGWARCLFGLWRARTIENGVLISFRWGGVFDCPRHGGGQAPALRWNCAVSIPFRRDGVSERKVCHLAHLA